MVSLVCVRFHVTQIMLLQKKNETNECNLTQRCIAQHILFPLLQPKQFQRKRKKIMANAMQLKLK